MLHGNPSRRNQLMLLSRVHPHRGRRTFVAIAIVKHANECIQDGFLAVTFHELESIITPLERRYFPSADLSAFAISSWRSSASFPASR
jgi:hypothetical protein